MIDQIISTLSVSLVPLILAITMHEAAHAWAASIFGDDTARRLGRMTLNPLPHVDPIGTIVLPGLMLAASVWGGVTNFIFGWAKPVPINAWRLSNPKRDMIWVALAGPASNFVQALAWLLVIKLVTSLPVEGILVEFVISTAVAGVKINFILMAFNLVPILPLDGGRELNALLPSRWSMQFERIERFGIVIVLLLAYVGLLNYYVKPIIDACNAVSRFVLG